MYSAILNAFYSTPLAIQPEKLDEIRAFLHLKADGGRVPQFHVEALEALRKAREERFLAALGAATRRPDGSQLVGRVGVLPIFGVISQRVGAMERASGGVSTEEIGAALDSLVADRQVKAIVLAFDSPGGSVYGVQELGDRIRAAREQKRIVGLADSVAASAAYWLIAQSGEVVVTPGGQVGSIGVISAHEDWSKRMDTEGVKTTLITSSPFKAEAHPFAPLADEARAELQRKVDHYHAAFVAAVAKGRGVTENRVAKDFGQGRMLTAADAKAAGMVDSVATLETVLRRLGEGDRAEKAIADVAARARCVEIQEMEGGG